MNVSIHKVAAVQHALRVAHPREAASIINASNQGASIAKQHSVQSQMHHGYTAAHRRLVNLRASHVRQNGFSPY